MNPAVCMSHIDIIKTSTTHRDQLDARFHKRINRSCADIIVDKCADSI